MVFLDSNLGLGGIEWIIYLLLFVFFQLAAIIASIIFGFLVYKKTNNIYLGLLAFIGFFFLSIISPI